MADVFDIIQGLQSALSEVVMRIAEMERKADNTIRHGKVTDVDTKKQLARIEIGERDGKPVKSAWVPYGQVAGEYKSHRPPTVGQQMTMFAPNGEIRQAILMPFTWSDQNQSPSDKPDEHVDTYGDDFKITRKKDKLIFTVGKSSLTFDKDKITAEVDGSKIEITKDKILNTAPAVKDVGKSYLGLTSENDTAKRIVVQDDQSSPRAFVSGSELVAEQDLTG